MKVEKVDFAIITILPEEFNAIDARFSPDVYNDPVTQNTYGISHMQTRAGKDCVVATASSYGPGNDDSQKIANNIIHDLDPQMLLVVGIGGGVPDTDFTLGDVVVSSHIHNFDVNAIKADKTSYDVQGGIHPLVSNITANLGLYRKLLEGWNSEASLTMPRPTIHLTEEELLKHIDKNVDEAWREKVEKSFKWHFNTIHRSTRAPIVFAGPIASSNTLVRNYSTLAQWLQVARRIRAVEMEVAGVYRAAQNIHHQYPVMTIRGISDIIGFERDDEWKLYACQTAAAFAYAFVTADIVKPRESIPSLDPVPDVRTDTPAIQPTHSSQGNTAMHPHNDDTSKKPDANTIKIFTIYAHDDKKAKERFYRQLAIYSRNKMIDLWDEDRIQAGSPSQEEINDHIDSSRIILLLVSPNFTYTARCLESMDYAIQRSAEEKKTIIPIYIRFTDWPEAPFEKLLTLPRNGTPVLEASSTEEAWYDTAKEIRAVCDGLRNPKK